VFESETSIRRRRSALSLLMEMGVPQESWPSLRHLVSDQEPRIAVLACDLCLSLAPKEEWIGAIHRLIELLENAGWRRESDIEECLVRHYGKAGKVMSALLGGDPAEDSDETEPPRIREVLLRVSARGECWQAIGGWRRQCPLWVTRRQGSEPDIEARRFNVAEVPERTCGSVVYDEDY
jgi:hypothetical protein